MHEDFKNQIETLTPKTFAIQSHEFGILIQDSLGRITFVKANTKQNQDISNIEEGIAKGCSISTTGIRSCIGLVCETSKLAFLLHGYSGHCLELAISDLKSFLPKGELGGLQFSEYLGEGERSHGEYENILKKNGITIPKERTHQISPEFVITAKLLEH